MKGVYILYWDTTAKKMMWNDSSTTGLGRWDYVIWKAKQLNLKLDIALLDFWQWAGGVQQINANFKGGNYDVSNASDRYTFFFTDSRTKQFYKDWVYHVLNRTNPLTGLKYKDEPTIFAWDLMNEPEISGTGIGQAWISEMSAYVKSIDPNHMVASGNEGFADGHAGSSPQLEMNVRTIDFATWHTYPTYHGLSPNDVVNLLNTNCQIAANGRKPVLLQEFGYPSNKSDQTSVYQSWMTTIQNNANCAGWLFWRLEGKQQSGKYAPDNGEYFSIYNNNSASAILFKNSASRLIGRSGVASPTSTPRPTNTPPPTYTPVPAAGETFVKGINFNGNAVTILGKPWLSYSSALSQGLTVSGASTDSKAVTPNPVVDSATSQMLNTLLYASTDTGSMSLNQTLTNGTYHIYLWTMENWQSNSRQWNLVAEGVQVATGLGKIALNAWKRYGPYTVTVKDSVLNLNLVGVVGRPMVMGLEIYSFK
jgi:mannan endo-1,4-beta-mannosidase